MSRTLPLLGLLLLSACGGEPGEKAQPGVADVGALTTNVGADDAALPANAAEEPTPDASATDNSTSADATDWIGRYTGPEGLFLTIAEGKAPGTVALVVKGDLDSAGDPFTGRVEADGIHFTRAGKDELLRRATGDETGLKWLAGKRDCLMVKSGEGWCRA